VLADIFGPRPTQGLLPVGKSAHLDCLSVLDLIHIRKLNVLPSIATLWSDPCMNEYDNPVSGRDELSGSLITSAHASRDCFK
jgi:hypothetical protein